jgi:hypothetical protein
MPDTCSCCDRKPLARGLCGKHYQRWSKYGDPNFTSVIMGDDERRFWSKVQRSEDGCWLWAGATDTYGYGRLQVQGRSRPAHRLAWEFTNGAIPQGLYVCHHCDVRACCRPDHLWLGTNDDNMHDCTSKGRRPSGDRNGNQADSIGRPRGDSHGSSKLTSAQVAALRAARASGTPSRELAVQYGISHTHVNRIVRGDFWKD